MKNVNVLFFHDISGSLKRMHGCVLVISANDAEFLITFKCISDKQLDHGVLCVPSNRSNRIYPQ